VSAELAARLDREIERQASPVKMLGGLRA
jgi:hypothetical protein